MFSLRIEVDNGWANATLSDGRNEATITASYISDALHDLVDSVARSVGGQAEARCEWQDEPGQDRWIFRRDGDDIAVTILRFSESFDWKPDEAGREVFSVELPAVRLGRVLLAEAQRLLDDLGADGYQTRWRYPFPAAETERLRAAVKAQPRTPRTASDRT